MVERLDRISLVSGMVFAVLGVLFALDDLEVVTLQARYVLPVVLIVAGLVLLAGALVRRNASGAGEGWDRME